MANFKDALIAGLVQAQSYITQVKDHFNSNAGGLDTLSTTNKTSLVSAINDIHSRASSLDVNTIDDTTVTTTDSWSSSKIQERLATALPTSADPTYDFVAVVDGEWDGVLVVTPKADIPDPTDVTQPSATIGVEGLPNSPLFNLVEITLDRPVDIYNTVLANTQMLLNGAILPFTPTNTVIDNGGAYFAKLYYPNGVTAIIESKTSNNLGSDNIRTIITLYSTSTNVPNVGFNLRVDFRDKTMSVMEGFNIRSLIGLISYYMGGLPEPTGLGDLRMGMPNFNLGEQTTETELGYQLIGNLETHNIQTKTFTQDNVSTGEFTILNQYTDFELSIGDRTVTVSTKATNYDDINAVLSPDITVYKNSSSEYRIAINQVTTPTSVVAKSLTDGDTLMVTYEFKSNVAESVEMVYPPQFTMQDLSTMTFNISPLQ